VAIEATKRHELGRALAAARRAAEMTQQAAAVALKCTQSKINKIEKTACVISSQDLDRLLRVYALSDEDCQRIRLLAAESGPGPSAGTKVNPEYLKLLDLEREAAELLVLHTERIPNLLQSEHYMLKQHDVAGRDPVNVGAILERRRQREQLFTIARPPRYHALFSESAFHRMPGGRTADLVIDQAEHVLGLCDKYPAHLTIQIIPWSANLAVMPYDLTVLRFTDPKQDQIYSEYGIGESRFYSGKDQVSRHVEYWTTAQRAALSPDESKKFLHGLIAEARTW
jgi:transcriptional regulator with XRE-family HTH domain